MLRRIIVSSVFVACAVVPAWAGQGGAVQTVGPFSLSVIGGASTGNGDSGMAAGATLAFELNDRVSLEGRGVYFDRGGGESAVDVNASVLVNLFTFGKVSPFVTFGGGAYMASFDQGGWWPGDPDDMPWSDMPFTNTPWGGMQWGGTQWPGMMFGSRQMPQFYARRVRDPMMLHDRGDTFVDPAVSFGGGVNIAITESLYVRPDARALAIFGGGDTYTIGSFTFSLGYRF